MTLADQAAMSEQDGQMSDGDFAEQDRAQRPARSTRRTFTAAYKSRIW